MDFPVKKVLSKKTASLKAVSDILEVPAEVLRWNIERFAGEDGMEKGVGYCMTGKQYWITLPGILWLAGRVQYKDYVKLGEMAETILTGGMREREEALKQGAQKAFMKIGDLNEALKLAQEAVADLRRSYEEIAFGSGREKAEKKEKQEITACRKNSPLLPELTGEQEEWLEKIKEVAEIKAQETGLSSGKLFRIAYAVMRSSYGVVFEQTRKDFAESNGLPPGTYIQKLRLITYHDNLRSILWGVMGNIEEYRDEKRVS